MKYSLIISFIRCSVLIKMLTSIIDLSTPKTDTRKVQQPPMLHATSEKSNESNRIKENDPISNNGENLDTKTCSAEPIMERVSDLDTTNIFPTLNFNVKLLCIT